MDSFYPWLRFAQPRLADRGRPECPPLLVVQDRRPARRLPGVRPLLGLLLDRSVPAVPRLL